MKKIALLGWMLVALLAGSYCAQAQDDDDDEEEERLERIEKQKLYASYGENFVRLYLLRLGDGDNLGFGFEYERIIDKNRKMGVVLPLHYSFGNMSGNTDEPSNYFNFNPGIKFYPSGQRKVTYAIGPSLAFGWGRMYDYRWDPITNTEQFDEIQRTSFGILVNNYLNVMLTKNFCLSADLGIGMSYWTRERNKFTNGEQVLSPRFIASFGVGFGIRF